jgi:hypothetical protein
MSPDATSTSAAAEANSYKALVAEIARLRGAGEALSERLPERDAGVAELEKLLSESRRSGKRQAAPFSKGDPREEPAKPGMPTGATGIAWHRSDRSIATSRCR